MMAKVGELFIYRKITANNLCLKLSKIHTTSETPSIMNLKQKLDLLRFDDKNYFNLHTRHIQEICDELSIYGKNIEDKNLV